MFHHMTVDGQSFAMMVMCVFDRHYGKIYEDVIYKCLFILFIHLHRYFSKTFINQ